MRTQHTPRRGRVITFAIQKGGTGKSTNSAHLTFYAARVNRRVLHVDLDPQANSAAFFTDALEDSDSRAGHLFLPDAPLTPLVVNEHIHLIVPDARLDGIGELAPEDIATFRTNLHRLAEHYDLVVIDTPPTMGGVVQAALAASDFAVSPVKPDSFSLRGVQRLLERVREAQANLNPGLTHLGLLITMREKKNQLHDAICEELMSEAKEHLIPWQISNNDPVERSPALKQPVWVGARSGAEKAAAREMRDAIGWIFDRVVEGGR